jgi:uncharacterized protein YbaP (TraB family)
VRTTALLMCSSSILVQAAFADSAGCPSERALAQRPIEQSVDTEAPFTHGMLWKVKPPDASASYLFGTIHLPIARLPPTVALALAKANHFVAETELDQTAMAYYQRHMVSKGGSDLVSALESPLRKRALELLTGYGVERQTALHLKLWAAFTLLSRPKPTSAPTLDQLLVDTARQHGKPVSALQSIKELVGTLEGIPLDLQREILIDTTCNRARLQREGQALIARYLEQDLGGMLAVSSRYRPRNPTVAQEFKKRMLDDRNRVMLQRLQAYLRMGNVFVAVGALHLPGKQGLLWGLKARGYRVTAVY